MIPMWDDEINLVGYQVRTDSGTPKYKTTRKPGAPAPTAIYGEGRGLYIVEDILSALNLALNFDYMFSAMPLFGTNLTNEHIACLIKWFKGDKIDHVIIWLDNDNPKIERKASEMYRQLQSLIPCSKCNLKIDPKEFR